MRFDTALVAAQLSTILDRPLRYAPANSANDGEVFISPETSVIVCNYCLYVTTQIDGPGAEPEFQDGPVRRDIKPIVDDLRAAGAI